MVPRGTILYTKKNYSQCACIALIETPPPRRTTHSDYGSYHPQVATTTRPGSRNARYGGPICLLDSTSTSNTNQVRRTQSEMRCLASLTTIWLFVVCSTPPHCLTPMSCVDEGVNTQPLLHVRSSRGILRTLSGVL
jgi:hypothetical protein